MKKLSIIFAILAWLPVAQASDADYNKAVKALKSGDCEAALFILEPLAEQGYEKAQAELSKMYFKGLCVEKDSEKAFEWANKNKEPELEEKQPLAEAENNIDVSVDSDEEDKKLFSRVETLAKQGDAEAQLQLADMYLSGQGVEADYDKAFEWITKAEESFSKQQENADAESQPNKEEQTEEQAEEKQPLAKTENNIDVSAEIQRGKKAYDDKEYKEAFSILGPVAEQENDIAQFFLGLMYYTGQGVDQSYEEAFKWFSKAAKQGKSEPQFFLGSMYEFGDGVKQSAEEATKWYSRAAKQEHVAAKTQLSKLEKKLADQGDADAPDKIGTTVSFE